MFECLDDVNNGIVQFWLGRVIPSRVIDKV